MSETRIKLVAGTNVGLIRKNNEDNFIVCTDLDKSQWTIPQVDEYVDLGQYGALLVVADGMGGANAGEVASAIAIDTVKASFTPEQLAKVTESEKAILEFEKDIVKAADLSIVNTSKDNSETQGMGTTFVLVWIYQKKAYVCWCGDSRCYVFNPNVGLTRLSKDHSYVQELIDKGELEPEYASDHPLSNVITRCLGDVEKRAVPDTRIYNLHTGDIILLCSDGLCGLCSDDDILKIIYENQENMHDCRDELITAALNAGGYDNVTVALCSVAIQSEVDDAMSSTIRGDAIGHKFPRMLIFLIVALIAAGIYIYTADACEPFRQQIATFTSSLIIQVKGWIPK